MILQNFEEKRQYYTLIKICTDLDTRGNTHRPSKCPCRHSSRENIPTEMSNRVVIIASLDSARMSECRYPSQARGIREGWELREGEQREATISGTVSKYYIRKTKMAKMLPDLALYAPSCYCRKTCICKVKLL